MNLKKDFKLIFKSPNCESYKTFKCLSFPIIYIESILHISQGAPDGRGKDNLANLKRYFWYYDRLEKDDRMPQGGIPELHNIPASRVSKEYLSLILLKYSNL
jgi:hypothetical protein